MKTITHPQLVKALCKPGQEIADELKENTVSHSQLMNSIEEIISVGRLLEATKKKAIYNKKDALIGTYYEGEYPKLNAKQAHLIHMAVGIVGESIELLEATYDHVAKGMPLDMENVTEESGDIEFYHEGYRQGVELDRETALTQNIGKLSKRYASLSYSDQAAQERADKATA